MYIDIHIIYKDILILLISNNNNNALLIFCFSIIYYLIQKINVLFFRF